MTTHRSSSLRWCLGVLLGSFGLAPLAACGASNPDGGMSSQDGLGLAGVGGTGGAGSPGSSGGNTSQGGSGLAGTAGLGGTSNGGAANQPSLECKNPVPFQSASTGWIACDGEVMHRPLPGTCTPHPPMQESNGANKLTGETCQSDADCDQTRTSRCVFSSQVLSPTCQVDCVTDADCEQGQVCVCGGNYNLCIPSDCKQDSDCGAGALCATVKGPCVFAPTQVRCQTPQDECLDASDCTGTACTAIDDHRVCLGAGGCGRPFLVQGEGKVSPVESRGDWADEAQSAPCVPHDARLRARLAHHWTQTALLEHASIAAFARFSLELLALGAPAALVADAGRAMLDEQRHAETCFALASAFAGAPVGPGPLELGQALSEVSFARMLETNFLEGCIGETVATLEARELADAATDPVLKAVLATIAEDESRHAALSFRVLRWALERAPHLAERVTELLGRERLAAREAVRAIRDEAPESHLREGLASAGWRARLRLDVLESVVAPMMDGLVSGGVEVVVAA